MSVRAQNNVKSNSYGRQTERNRCRTSRTRPNFEHFSQVDIPGVENSGIPHVRAQVFRCFDTGKVMVGYLGAVVPNTSKHIRGNEIRTKTIEYPTKLVNDPNFKNLMLGTFEQIIDTMIKCGTMSADEFDKYVGDGSNYCDNE